MKPFGLQLRLFKQNWGPTATKLGTARRRSGFLGHQLGLGASLPKLVAKGCPIGSNLNNLGPNGSPWMSLGCRNTFNEMYASSLQFAHKNTRCY